MKYTLNGIIECLEEEGNNSKELAINALRTATSTDLIGLKNDINKTLALKVIKERKGERQ